MITLASNVAWGSAPTIHFDFDYESKREGGIQFYRLQISCQPITGASYYGYPIYLEISLDGTVQATATFKKSSVRQWEEPLRYIGDWLSTSRIAGETALIIRIYSGSGSSRNIRYSYALPLDSVTSTVTATDAYIGSTSTIIISRASSALRHTLAYRMDGDTEYTEIVKLTDQNTVGWTIPTTTYAKIPNASTIGVTIRCDTYDGTELLGATSCRMTARCDPARCAPLVSLTANDVRPETVALTGDGKKIIAGQSTIHAEVAALAREGATLSTIYYDFGDWSLTHPATITAADRIGATVATVTVRVTDSRGLSTEVSATDLTLLIYVAPYVYVSAKRGSAAEGTATITASGRYWQGNFGTTENVLTVRVRARDSGGNYTDWAEMTATPAEDNRFTATAELSGLDYTQVYTIEAEAADLLSSDTDTSQLMRGIPLFDWGETDFCFRIPVRMLKGAELSSIDCLRDDGTLQAQIQSASGITISAFDNTGERIAAISVSDNGDVIIAGTVTIVGDLTVSGTINGA